MCTCRLMSSRAPNAPPTPPSTRRTCSSGRPRQAAICLRSSCSHCVAMCSSTPRAVVVGDGQRRLEAEERLVLHADLVRALDDDVAGGVDVAADDRAGGGGRCRRDGSAGACRRSPPRGRAAGRAPRTSRRSRPAPAGRSRGGRRPRRRPARRRSARRRWRTPAGRRRSARTSSLPGTSSAVRRRRHAGDRQRRRRRRCARCGRTGAASAAWRPTPRRRSAGRRRTAKRALRPWRSRRAGPASRRCRPAPTRRADRLEQRHAVPAAARRRPAARPR